MTTLATDTMVRANQSGGGTASDGVNVWGTPNHGGIDIASNELRFQNTSGQDAWVLLGTQTTAPINYLIRTASDNLSMLNGIAWRFNTTGGGNGYRAGFDNFFGTNGFGIDKYVSGNRSNITSFTFGGNTRATGQYWWVRIIHDSSNQLMIRVWQDGTSEPSTWNYNASDTTYTTAGQFGLSIFGQGATTYAYFDHLTVTDNQSSSNTFTAPPDSVSLSESFSIVNLWSGSESSSLSELLVAGGNPATIDTVSVADLNQFVGKATIASESVAIGEVTAFTGKPSTTENVGISELNQVVGVTSVASENAQPGEGTPTLTGVSSSTDTVQPSDQSTLQGVMTIASENVALSDQSTLTGKPSTSDSVQPGEGIPTLQGGMQSTDTAGGSDQTNLLGSTQIASENVLLGDSVASVGAIQSTNNTQISDQSTLQGASQIAPESVAVGESTSQTGQTANIESAALNENYSQIGLNQNLESAQLGEDLHLTSQSQIVEIVPLGESYFLVGSTQNTESVLPSEQYTLTGLITINPESVQLGESVSLFTATVFIAPAEGVLLSEQYSLSGSTQNTESTPLSDQYTLQGGMAIAPEQVTISELLQLVGNAQNLETSPLSDSSTLQGGTQAADLVALSELVQLTSSGTAIFVAPPDSVLLSESVSLVGSVKIAESVQLLDLGIFAIFPPSNVVFYVRSGDIAVYTRPGDSNIYTRSGDITVNSREGNIEVFTRSGDVTLHEE